MRKFIYSPKIILFFILLIGLFFRLYKLEVFYPWGHDQDLFAWIAKDILIDHHFRLIGQETSIIGVFIGPLFYYLVALSFVLFKMNPLSAVIVTNLVSLFTMISIYWVFSTFFGRNTGLIGVFLYAVSPGTVFLDRWVVPTQPTILWTVWFLYILLSILKGNLNILILLSILIGLILHIHIAFIPLLILLPVAYLMSAKKNQWFKYSPKTVLISLLIFFSLISPFLIFEVRHGFGQIKSLFGATYKDTGDLTGVKRLFKVINSGGISLAGTIVLSNTATELPVSVTSLLPLLLLIGSLYLKSLRILSKGQMLLIIAWFLVVFVGQFVSKRIITEYYFNNLFVLVFLVFTLFLIRLKSSVKFPAVEIILGVYLIIITVWFINRPDDLGGYLYKRKAVEFIKYDASSKGYPCVAVTHIENNRAPGNGFRYLYWLNGLNVITSGNDVPVYNIVIPWTISKEEVKAKFGDIGIITPFLAKKNSEICRNPNRQLKPLWGFNN